MPAHARATADRASAAAPGSASEKEREIGRASETPRETSFEQLLAELVEEYRPEGRTEELLVHRLAVAFWGLFECDALERALARARPRPPEGALFPDPEVPALLTRSRELASVLRRRGLLQRELASLLRLLGALRSRRERAASDRPASAREPETARPPKTAGGSGPAATAPVRAEPEAAAGVPFGPRADGGNDADRPRPKTEAAASPTSEPASSATPRDGSRAAPVAADRSDPPPRAADPRAAEALLVARARANPALALHLVEHALESGDLARLMRWAPDFAPILAAAREAA
ncbi:MAG: hypothetical protein RMK73_02440 [Geminicoccaceae bacterium]|nr:hypothetical protein [Geminicoccaceae bacterium]MDW8125847.1 hypothetical protein [Geminicoccaceae bacterium]MDW8340322.1 hypothetical protein [Geminicoccaceae bacterium]